MQLTDLKKITVLFYSCFLAPNHSFLSLITTGPQPIPKPVPHTVWSSASSFNLQYSRFLKVIHWLLTSSSSSSRHLYPSPYLSLKNLFQKAVSTQNLTNPFSLPYFHCMQHIPWISTKILHISHGRSSCFPWRLYVNKNNGVDMSN